MALSLYGIHLSLTTYLEAIASKPNDASERVMGNTAVNSQRLAATGDAVFGDKKAS